MILPFWALLAISAAIIWGMGYAISGHLLSRGITPVFMVALTGILTLPVYLFILHRMGQFSDNIQTLVQDKNLLFLFLVQAVAIIIANILIYTAIQNKNASYVSVIEISYPLFVFIFGWLFFRDAQLSWNLVIGGSMIFIGSAIVLMKT